MRGTQNHMTRSRAHCYNESGSGKVGTLVSTGEWGLNTTKLSSATVSQSAMLSLCIFKSKRWLMMLTEEIIKHLVLVSSQNIPVSNRVISMNVQVVEGVQKDPKLIFQVTSLCPIHFLYICE